MRKIAALFLIFLLFAAAALGLAACSGTELESGYSDVVEEFYGEDMSDEELENLVWVVVDKYNAINPVYKQIRKINVRKAELKKNTSKKIIRFAEENK